EAAVIDFAVRGLLRVLGEVALQLAADLRGARLLHLALQLAVLALVVAARHGSFSRRRAIRNSLTSSQGASSPKGLDSYARSSSSSSFARRALCHSQSRSGNPPVSAACLRAISSSMKGMRKTSLSRGRFDSTSPVRNS